MSEKQQPTFLLILKHGPILLIFCIALGLFHFFGNSARGYIDSDSIFVWWIKQWLPGGGDTQHGFLILALAIWIFKINFDDLRKSNDSNLIKFDLYWGVGIIIASFGIHLIGFLVQQTRISIFGFLLFCVGLVRLGYGKRMMQVVVFPLFFMIFSMPLGFLSDEVGYHLRSGVVKLAYGISTSLGVDVIRNGTQLFSASDQYNYDVEPACSGIRSLVALTALSLIIGYLYFRSWWRRALLFFLSFPFAFLGNVLRILSIILVAEMLGQAAGNFVHEWFGFIIFGIVIGLALFTVWLLNRFLPEQKFHKPVTPKEQNGQLRPQVPTRLHGYAFVVVLAAIISCGFCVYRVDHMTYRYLNGVRMATNEQDPVTLPNFLGIDWGGRYAEVTDVERNYLPSDTGYSRKLYVNLEDPGTQVYLSIVLSGRDRSSIHRPEICLVAQGWTIKDRFIHDYLIDEENQKSIRATVLRIEREINETTTGKPVILKSLYTYWFVAGDDMVYSHRNRMIKMAIDRLFRFRSHRWAYVTVQTVVPNQDENKALAMIQEVLQQTVPEFIEEDLVK